MARGDCVIVHTVVPCDVNVSFGEGPLDYANVHFVEKLTGLLLCARNLRCDIIHKHRTTVLFPSARGLPVPDFHLMLSWTTLNESVGCARLQSGTVNRLI